jgi:hypothetical protein
MGCILGKKCDYTTKEVKFEVLPEVISLMTKID